MMNRGVLILVENIIMVFYVWYFCAWLQSIHFYTSCCCRGMIRQICLISVFSSFLILLKLISSEFSVAKLDLCEFQLGSVWSPKFMQFSWLFLKDNKIVQPHLMFHVRVIHTTLCYHGYWIIPVDEDNFFFYSQIEGEAPQIRRHYTIIRNK